MIARLLDDGRWLWLYVALIAAGAATGAGYVAASIAIEWIRGRWH
ncbi:hypothetical protein [Streptomyces sp. LRE541]|nr:hypothetical protein [Streptomyces sp. LRE541]